MSTQGYRIEFKDVLERTFLPEGIFIEERNERLFPLSKHIFEHIPSRLFRYRDCSEMKFDDFHVEKTEHAVTVSPFSSHSTEPKKETTTPYLFGRYCCFNRTLLVESTVAA